MQQSVSQATMAAVLYFDRRKFQITAAQKIAGLHLWVGMITTQLFYR